MVALPRTNPANRRSTFRAFSSRIEVEEPRQCVQLLLENEYPLVFDDVADLAVFVEEVAELSRAHRARFHTSGILAGARPLNTESALLDDTLGPRPVAQIMRLGVQLVL